MKFPYTQHPTPNTQHPSGAPVPAPGAPHTNRHTNRGNHAREKPLWDLLVINRI
ncbi:MAG: hypothetical protein F6J93_25895 [Oscillatoria sp. SIO1A7]|nr:hypothetical protein [Oscillatoria sp. SIO1A7]